MGIEISDRDEPDWHTAKTIQDKVLDVIMEAGIKLNFDRDIEESESPSLG